MVLSEKYNVSISLVSQVRNGWIWTHITNKIHPRLKDKINKKQVFNL